MRARQTRGPACRAGRGWWYHLKGLSASKFDGDPQGICRENAPGPGASCAVELRRSAHEIISAFVTRAGQPLELAVEVRENADFATARLQKSKGGEAGVVLWRVRWGGRGGDGGGLIEELVYLETEFGGASAGASLSGHTYAKAGWWGQALKGGKWGGGAPVPSDPPYGPSAWACAISDNTISQWHWSSSLSSGCGFDSHTPNELNGEWRLNPLIIHLIEAQPRHNTRNPRPSSLKKQTRGCIYAQFSLHCIIMTPYR